MILPEEITKKVNKVIAKYVDERASVVQMFLERIICNRFKSDIFFFLTFIENDVRNIKIYRNQLIDESIEEYEYHECDHITGTNHNNSGDDIRLVLNHKTYSHILTRAT